MHLIDKVNLVLITHSGTEFSGSLPLIHHYFLNKPQILATIPVSRLSFISFFDLILNKTIPLGLINKIDYF